MHVAGHDMFDIVHPAVVVMMAVVMVMVVMMLMLMVMVVMMLMLMLMIVVMLMIMVMMMLMHVLVFFFAVDQHMDMGAGDPALDGTFFLYLHTGDPQSVHFRKDRFGIFGQF